jgi:hypothetical protein
MIVKKILLIGLIFLAFAILILAILIGPYALRVQHFTANPANGYHADFYLYVSPKSKQAAKSGEIITILVQPNNSGINSDDPSEHQQDAWLTGYERQKIADELGVVLLVPAFIRPGEDWFIYTHALDRDALITTRSDLARIDLQLIAMIDQARLTLTDNGINTDDRIFIQGFSASGMFANRFTGWLANCADLRFQWTGFTLPCRHCGSGGINRRTLRCGDLQCNSAIDLHGQPRR